MKVIKEISAIQDISDYYRCTGKKVALVPTMGFLHEGHISLIQKSREDNEVTVVSIFVNPTQFGVNEDFNKYPRDFKRDYDICEKERVDYIFNPETMEMYDNSLTNITVSEITDRLEGKFRQGHFTGVATVVMKLINAVKPHSIYLGQKDAQQNAVLKKMVKDLNADVKINICETKREENGLAMSSRNSYLTPEQKADASILYYLLNEGKKLVLENQRKEVNDIISEIGITLKQKQPGIELQYYEITDNENLDSITDLKNFKGEVLISLAAKIGNTRLIDNIVFTK